MRGKEIRLERIINRNTKRTIIVPMDHGVSQGPIDGLIDLGDAVDAVALGGANAVLGHIGLALYGHRRRGPDVGLILHLSASTAIAPDPNEKVLVNTVTNALRMGADAVSMHVNIGADSEARMLEDLGRVAVQCQHWGMPLLAMMYPRGRKIEDEHAVGHVKLAARVAAELGADIVKTVYTGDPDSFREVTRGCPVPGGGRGRLQDRRPRDPRPDRGRDRGRRGRDLDRPERVPASGSRRDSSGPRP